jgi:hypothetical protein
MTLEKYVKKFPVVPSSIVLDYGAGSRSEIVEIPSPRWEELKKAKLEDMHGPTVHVQVEIPTPSQ